MKRTSHLIAIMVVLTGAPGAASADIQHRPDSRGTLTEQLEDLPAEETPSQQESAPFETDSVDLAPTYGDWSPSDPVPGYFSGEVNVYCQAFIPECGYSEEDIYFAEHGTAIPQEDW